MVLENILKKFILLFIALVVSFPAFANHHRSHALTFLKKADLKMVSLKNTRIPGINAAANGQIRSTTKVIIDPITGRKIADKAPGPRTAMKFYNGMVAKANRVRYQIAAAQALLRSPVCNAHDVNELLTDVRRILNQPKGGETAANTSALTKFSELAYFKGQLQRYAEPADLDYYQLGAYDRVLAEAWVFIDRALWHVQDAYREEVINRPEQGVGHDPLVDPLGFGQAYIFDPCE